MEIPPTRRSKRLSRKHDVDGHLAKPNFGELLSTEIWLMIFEELSHDLEYEVRLVSKRFNAIAVAVLFRCYTLNDKITASRPDPLTARMAEIVKAHTKEFRVYWKLNWYRAAKFLSDCRAFRDLRWHKLSKEGQSLPMPLQTASRSDWLNVRLHFSNMYSVGVPNEHFRAESFSGFNLVEMELDDSTTFEEGGVDKLNALLASSKGLKRLAVGPLVRFTASHGRLPAIRTLSLSGDCWPYQPTDISGIWDFSRLKSLSFKRTDIREFAESVPFHSLVALKELSVREDDSNSFREQMSASTHLAEFIAKLQGLQKIDVDMTFPTKVLDSLRKHGDTLRELSISSNRQAEEWLAPHHVKGISVSCPHLVGLNVEFKVPSYIEEGERLESYAMDFVKEGVNVIAGFRNLRRLTIEYIVDAEYESRSLYRDWAFEVAVDHLSRRNQGVQLERLSLAFETPGFDHNSDFGPSVDYEWDSEGRLMFFDEFDPDEVSDDSSDDSD